MEDLSIPDFLKIDAETRKANWSGQEVISCCAGFGLNSPTASALSQQELRERHERARKAKAAAALARMKEEHAGERWHPKLGWIRDEKSLAALEAQQLAEFEEEERRCK